MKQFVHIQLCNLLIHICAKFLFHTLSISVIAGMCPTSNLCST